MTEKKTHEAPCASGVDAARSASFDVRITVPGEQETTADCVSETTRFDGIMSPGELLTGFRLGRFC